MSILQVYTEARASAQVRGMEGVEVRVVPPLPGIVLTEEVVRVVAPLLAADLHPDRSFGGILHMEPTTTRRSGREVVVWDVVVEDRGVAS